MPADRPLRVAGIAGSLRRGSFNRGLLRAAVESAPDGMTIESLEIRDLPLYDADLDVDGGPRSCAPSRPASSRRTASSSRRPSTTTRCPACSRTRSTGPRARPSGRSKDKPVAIVGATPGRWGTVRSQLALRQMLMFPACRVMPAPLMTIAGAREHFDADGNLTDAETRAQLVGVLEAFATWIRQVSCDRRPGWPLLHARIS